MRLVFIVLLPATVLCGLGTAFVMRSAATQAYGPVRASAAATMEAVAALVEPGRRAYAGALGRLAEARQMERIWVTDAGGQVLVSSHADDLGTALPAPWWQLLEATTNEDVAEEVRWGDRPMWLVARQVGPEHGWAVAVRDAATVAPGLGWRLATLGLLGLLGWAATVALGWVLLRRRVLRPLRQVEDLLAPPADGEGVTPATVQRVRAEVQPYVPGLAEAAADAVERTQALARDQHALQGRLFALLELLPGPAWVGAPDGTLLHVNTALASAVGHPDDALRGQRLDALGALLPAGPLARMAQRCCQDGLVLRAVELPMTPCDAPSQTVTITLHPLPLGAQQGYAALVMEQGGGEEVERRLAEYEDHFELLVEERLAELRRQVACHAAVQRQASTLGAVVGEEGRVLHWSEGLRMLTGRPARTVPDQAALAEVLAGADGTDAVRRWLNDPFTDTPITTTLASLDGPQQVTWVLDEAYLDDRPVRVVIGWPAEGRSERFMAADRAARDGAARDGAARGEAETAEERAVADDGRSAVVGGVIEQFGLEHLGADVPGVAVDEAAAAEIARAVLEPLVDGLADPTATRRSVHVRRRVLQDAVLYDVRSAVEVSEETEARVRAALDACGGNLHIATDGNTRVVYSLYVVLSYRSARGPHHDPTGLLHDASPAPADDPHQAEP